MVHGTVPSCGVFMMPARGRSSRPGVSLVPLRIGHDGAARIVGNLLVFPPPPPPDAWGSSPMRSRRGSDPGSGAGAGCSVLVETVVRPAWRVSSVDDVLVNATGAALAACVPPWWRTSRNGAGPASASAATPHRACSCRTVRTVRHGCSHGRTFRLCCAPSSSSRMARGRGPRAARASWCEVGDTRSAVESARRSGRVARMSCWSRQRPNPTGRLDATLPGPPTASADPSCCWSSPPGAAVRNR